MKNLNIKKVSFTQKNLRKLTTLAMLTPGIIMFGNSLKSSDLANVYAQEKTKSQQTTESTSTEKAELSISKGAIASIAQNLIIFFCLLYTIRLALIKSKQLDKLTMPNEDLKDLLDKLKTTDREEIFKMINNKVKQLEQKDLRGIKNTLKALVSSALKIRTSDKTDYLVLKQLREGLTMLDEGEELSYIKDNMDSMWNWFVTNYNNRKFLNLYRMAAIIPFGGIASAAINTWLGGSPNEALGTFGNVMITTIINYWNYYGVQNQYENLAHQCGPLIQRDINIIYKDLSTDKTKMKK